MFSFLHSKFSKDKWTKEKKPLKDLIKKQQQQKKPPYQQTHHSCLGYFSFLFQNSVPAAGVGPLGASGLSLGCSLLPHPIMSEGCCISCF